MRGRGDAGEGAGGWWRGKGKGRAAAPTLTPFLYVILPHFSSRHMTGGGSCPIKPSRRESDGTRRGPPEGLTGSLPRTGLFMVLDGPWVMECPEGRFFGRFSRV